MKYLLLLFYFIFFSLSNGAAVSYVYTPSCTAGCNFLGDIWNTTLSAGDQVTIISNETITLYLNDSILSLSFLYFGELGAPVKIILSNSSLVLTSNYTNLVWGYNSTLILYNRSSISALSVEGYTLSLYGSSIKLYQLFLFGILAEDSWIESPFSVYSNYAEISNSYFSSYMLEVGTFYGNNVTFNSSVRVFDSIMIYNSSFPFNIIPPSVTLLSTAIAEFHNTLLTISDLEINVPSRFSFFAQDTKNYLSVFNVISFYSTIVTEVHLGDNVQATFINGVIYYLTLGNNVNISLGSNDYHDMFSVINIQQMKFDYFSNIIFKSEGILGSISPINASIYLAPFASPVIHELILAPGSKIFGEGAIVVDGDVYCSGGNITIDTIVWASGTLTVNTLSVATFTLSNYYYALNGSIIGNVFVQDGGMYIYRSAFNITGDLILSNGALNLTLDKIYATSPRLVVGGLVSITKARIDPLLDVVNSEDKFLLVESLSLNVNVLTTVIDDHNIQINSDKYSLSLSDSIEKGKLYLVVLPKTVGKRDVYIALIATGGALVIGISIGLFVQCRKTCKHRQYDSIKLSG